MVICEPTSVIRIMTILAQGYATVTRMTNLPWMNQCIVIYYIALYYIILYYIILYYLNVKQTSLHLYYPVKIATKHLLNSSDHIYCFWILLFRWNTPFLYSLLFKWFFKEKNPVNKLIFSQSSSFINVFFKLQTSFVSFANMFYFLIANFQMFWLYRLSICSNNY